MSLRPPFALFVLDKDITNDYINDSLRRAYDGDDQCNCNIYVATDSYDDIPLPQEVHKPPPKATEPPLPERFSSPWIGKTVEDCAEWLENMPRATSSDDKRYLVDTGVNDENFLVMTEFSRKEDSVLVCRIVKEDTGKTRVDYFPQQTGEVQRQMWTNWGVRFDEKATDYQRARFADKKPDRSRFKPLDPEK